MSDRARGVMLRTIPLEKHLAESLRLAQMKDPTVTEAKALFQPYAVALAGDDTYVVCAEGVGWPISDKQDFTIEVFLTREKGTEQLIGMAHEFEIHMTISEVLDEAVGGEEIDLADLVRSFGARLESNFWTWHSTLTRKAGAES